MRFYPHTEDAGKGSYPDRLELLLEAAQQYKAVVLDVGSPIEPNEETTKKRMVPRDQTAAFNWEEIASVLRHIRELPEGDKALKLTKAELLTRLAEVYEVLRAAKMSKLEAVRLALISEANQLRGSSTQVA